MWWCADGRPAGEAERKDGEGEDVAALPPFFFFPPPPPLIGVGAAGTSNDPGGLDSLLLVPLAAPSPSFPRLSTPLIFSALSSLPPSFLAAAPPSPSPSPSRWKEKTQRAVRPKLTWPGRLEWRMILRRVWAGTRDDAADEEEGMERGDAVGEEERRRVRPRWG